MKKEDSKKVKKALAQHTKKVKNTTGYENKINTYFNIDISPADMYLPKKYYTAIMEADDVVNYFNKGDILIIDPSIKRVRESGIYAFEFQGNILIRQFQVIPSNKNGLTFRAVGKYMTGYNEIYTPNEINIIGAVISKHVEIFHNLYGIHTSRRRF